MTTETARPVQVIKYALWFGLLTGLIEAALTGVKSVVQGRFVRVGPDIAWMAPVADAFAFLAIALVLIGLARVVRAAADVRVAPLVFGFCGFLSLLFMYYPLHLYAKVLLSLGLAVRLAFFAGRRTAGFDRLVSRTLVPAVVVVAAIALMTRVMMPMFESEPSDAQSTTVRAPNVLLIVWDTVRAQNLSLYGYRRRTTPNLEKWAESSTVFEQASSPSPWTLPAHASMLTGQWPQDLSTDWETPLDGRHRTLGEVLSPAGYRTGAFVANTYYCGRELGIARGFGHFEDYVVSPGELVMSSMLMRNIVNSTWFRGLAGYHDNLPRRSAQNITDQFLDWQLSSSRTVEKPFFAFLNYYDAHESYLPPAPYDEMFGPGPVQGGPQVIQDLRRSLRFDWPERPAGEIEREVNMYDGAIAYLDHELNRLLLALQSRGVLDNTIVIVTSDHGEQFGEHGLFLHGNSLYRPLLHVPLVVRYPQAVPPGRRVRAQATLRDLPATVLELIAPVVPPSESLPGRSWSRHWSGAAPGGAPDDAAIAEVRKADWAQHRATLYPVAKGDMESVTDAEYHYIRNGDGREELYAIASDPDERANLATRPESAPALERFRALLRARQLQSGR